LNWHILKTEPHRETFVEKALLSQAFETYLPLEYYSITVSRQARRFQMMSKPMVPRTVFVLGDSAKLSMLDVRYAKGLATSQGEIWNVSPTQMRKFQEGIASDLYGDGAITRQELKSYKAKLKAQNTAHSLADLTRLKPQLFGE
jgi:Transcription termination factor nusG